MGANSRHRKAGRVTAKGVRPRTFDHRHRAETAEPDLLVQVQSRLASGQPLDLLAEVSSLVAAVDPRAKGPFDRTGRSRTDQVTLDYLITTFTEADCLETSALLAILGELAPGELERARARRALAFRSDDLPIWLERLGDADAYRCVEMVDVLGDGDNVIVGLRLPGDHHLTFVVYVDHNLGSLVKDAFVIPRAVDEVVALMKEHHEAPVDTEWRDLDPADARARIIEAVELAAMTFPPFESESWPACRPLVEWVATLLPPGGHGYVRPEWDEPAQRQLTDGFFASVHGVGLDDPERRDLFDSIMWFATDYGPGDPLRWSPVAVELLLTDWIPRKIVAPAKLLQLVPDLLRAYIRYCHHRRAIRSELTDETVAAVDRYEPLYQRLIRSSRPQGPEALLAALGFDEPEHGWTTAFDPDVADGGFDDDNYYRFHEDPFDEDPYDQDPFDEDPYDRRITWMDDLRGAAGGEQALAELHDRPLPDEPFDWTGIVDDVRPQITEILGLLDRFCDQHLDVEYRTACRRLLHRSAAAAPEVYRRKARTDNTAAAICWIVARTNELFAPCTGGMTVKYMMQQFGLTQTSPGSRAYTLIHAAGLRTNYGYGPAGGYATGVPELLVSTRRRRLIDLRDAWATEELT